MKDPTRIAPVLEQLRTTWEGQPDLSLPTLFGILGNQGIGWGTDDEVLMEALRGMQHLNPPRIGPDITARFVVETISPDSRVTIDPFRVVVRRDRGRGKTQPGVWSYRDITRCEVGTPLVITDREDIRHRLGVVTAIHRVSDAPLQTETGLTGLTRELIDDRVALLKLSGDSTVVLSRTMHVFTADRRELAHVSHPWTRLVQARPDHPLVVEVPQRRAHLELGTVEDCFYIEG
ncbi:hypothetical protein CFAEC_02105 [Corynebacterium faecale]|uniref:hypothetical protein n=1 Tax=Corynebacterium faecale TaxID=1758466 RepID=UPI0025B606B8|nr:hypothetical protein [Corynebacterium faecale]WJY91276.1 hypothetical protein CFAEC_02105 [Corynebacterium faecale]